ncbi:MAG: ATP-binding cassette domain-containing protein [Verrucomicrobiota bacterium]
MVRRYDMGDAPMIEVDTLTKRYAGRAAVEAISFTVQRGEVVGLLGPNGAGKSTTMRILSCYLPATSGTARVAGFDVFTQSEEVRRRIGYMPENNPLHHDMRVRDYLKFRARLKGLNRKDSRTRVDLVMTQCGLTDVTGRVIGQLSKGYQQRVGLADALVHDPELLILDEPTIGLDPNQIRAVRQLIKDLAKQHTVLLSSHILPEVEMTCGRVMILGNGKILAADTPANLHKLFREGTQVVAEIAAPAADLKACWDSHPEVDHYDIAPAEGEYLRCSLTARPGVDLRPLVFELVAQRGWKLRELTRNRYSLEDVFVRLTRPDKEEES